MRLPGLEAPTRQVHENRCRSEEIGSLNKTVCKKGFGQEVRLSEVFFLLQFGCHKEYHGLSHC